MSSRVRIRTPAIRSTRKTRAETRDTCDARTILPRVGRHVLVLEAVATGPRGEREPAGRKTSPWLEAASTMSYSQSRNKEEMQRGRCHTPQEVYFHLLCFRSFLFISSSGGSVLLGVHASAWSGWRSKPTIAHTAACQHHDQDPSLSRVLRLSSKWRSPATQTVPIFVQDTACEPEDWTSLITHVCSIHTHVCAHASSRSFMFMHACALPHASVHTLTPTRASMRAPSTHSCKEIIGHTTHASYVACSSWLTVFHVVHTCRPFTLMYANTIEQQQ